MKKKRKQTSKTKKKISFSLKKYFSNPAVKKKVSRIMKKRYSNHLERKKISVSLKKYFSNPKRKERASRIRKRYYKKHPEFLEKMDRAVTRWWKSHPSIRKEMSIRAKKLFIESPDKFRKFMKYGRNVGTLRFKTKQKFTVRSQGEKKIADFLFDNKISSFYEAKTLFFKKEGLICVPDFYLPSYKIYIEFYGGFPKAWKKKVMKNHLYKKYKIPCIFITPAELKNLDYYLVRELIHK